MRHLVLMFITLATPALSQQRAEFIDGTYVFSPGACDKLHALAAGGVQAITTVPWHVTADGIKFWEGGCDYKKVSKGKKNNQWHVIAACEENGDETTERYTYLRTAPGSFDVTLTTPGISPEEAKPLRYTRCDVGKIPDPQ
jgi:hypothetical protein